MSMPADVYDEQALADQNRGSQRACHNMIMRCGMKMPSTVVQIIKRSPRFVLGLAKKIGLKKHIKIKGFIYTLTKILPTI